MIKYIYALKNEKGGFFNDLKPDTLKPEDEFEILSQTFITADEKSQAMMKELSLYCLGTFDTVSGAVKPECTYINSLGSLLNNGKE